MSVWPFQVRIETRKHQARGPRSLPQDLPDLGQRLGTLTPCLLILGVWPFHHRYIHCCAFSGRGLFNALLVFLLQT